MEKCEYNSDTVLWPLTLRTGENKIQTINRDNSCTLAALPLKVWISLKFGFCPKSKLSDFGQNPNFGEIQTIG